MACSKIRRPPLRTNCTTSVWQHHCMRLLQSCGAHAVLTTAASTTVNSAQLETSLTNAGHDQLHYQHVPQEAYDARCSWLGVMDV
jgi:hypothetical protein